uniref:NADH-ubiquinone oxidoreductase chain 4 n=1 Tax=Crioceris asparagi TaxID=131627 RepID=A0A1P8NN85_CRIAP|nr:NADH dehydrogenase subunit 4 [Crioceris asparagi]
MMKFIVSLIFLIPLCFNKNYWLMQWVFLILSFLFIFEYTMNLGVLNLSYIFGCDYLSYYLVLLSFWICALMLMASEKLFKESNYYKMFLFMIIFLMISLFFTFVSLNFFVFYLFFEVSLIPVLFLIIGWGYQPERLEAGLYLLFYTLLMSLPMMIAIFYYYNSNYSLIFYLMTGDMNLYMYLCINMVFFCKIPMFFIHLWLPKAHVEAPVAGSMILAGVMLKLGGYGLMRLLPLFMSLTLNIGFIFIVISLVGGMFVSLICLRQSDIKSLIAYSSVAHMGLVVAGLMTMSLWGYYGSLMMMIAHGLCSSGLFCLANIVYERLLTRSLYLSKGLLNIFPSLSFWWFMLLIGNMAAPVTLNLFSEIMLINSLVFFNSLTIIFLSLLSFFSAVYSLYLYSFSQHGTFNKGIYSIYQGFYREYLLLFMHWLPLNLLFLKSALIMLI